MKLKYVCDILKMILAGIGLIVFIFLSIACLAGGIFLLAIVFMILSAIYLYLFANNASMICIDDKGIARKTFGKTVLFFEWEDIMEAGILNGRFVYFSKESMSEDERLRMAFQWPPKNIIYFRSNKKSAEKAELIWNKRDKLFIKCEAGRFFKYI